jgi:hypothetical protein
MASTEHLYFTSLVAKRARKMRNFVQIYIEAKISPEPRVKCKHMLEIEVEVPSKLANSATHVHRVAKASDEWLT